MRSLAPVFLHYGSRCGCHGDFWCNCKVFTVILSWLQIKSGYNEVFVVCLLAVSRFVFPAIEAPCKWIDLRKGEEAEWKQADSQTGAHRQSGFQVNMSVRPVLVLAGHWPHPVLSPWKHLKTNQCLAISLSLFLHSQTDVYTHIYLFYCFFFSLNNMGQIAYLFLFSYSTWPHQWCTIPQQIMPTPTSYSVTSCAVRTQINVQKTVTE